VVKVNMYVDGLLTGSKHIPYLPGGHSRMVRMDYDPSGRAEATPMKSLGVRVFSEAAGFARDGEDPLSHFVERDLVGSADDTGGSGGGCDAELGAALIAFGVFGVFGSVAARNANRPFLMRL
jgi:hypothetical protein